MPCQASTFSTNSGRSLLNAGDVEGAIHNLRRPSKQSAGYAPAQLLFGDGSQGKGKTARSES